METSLLLIFLFSFSVMHNLKAIQCMGILCVLNDCSTIGHLPFLVYGAVRTTTGELWPPNYVQRHIVSLFGHFYGFC